MSIELAVTELITDLIVQKLHRGKLPLAIFLDLSKAFNTFNRDMLLNKLRFYDISFTELHFFNFTLIMGSSMSTTTGQPPK